MAEEVSNSTTNERWDHVKDVFHAVLQASSASERAEILGEAGRDDPALRAEVESLLAAHGDVTEFLESPLMKVNAGEIEEAVRRGVLLGRTIGPYRMDALLGSGGMGEVYRATDTRLGRLVAVKVLPPHLCSVPQFRQRLEREAKALSNLNHPHVCALYDIGRHEDVDYLVMEYIEGQTLAARLERGPLPIAEALEAAVQIARALEQAHRRGLVHRDLKPGNIMLTKSGAKLLDFGLAKPSKVPLLNFGHSGTRPATEALTGEGVLVGTFQYMAPEQLESKDADERTDIFAFGAVLYEMVTGRRAFEGTSQASVIAAIIGAQPPTVTSLQPLAPRPLERLIRVCLAKDPDERWQSAHDLASELEWIRVDGRAPLDERAPVSRKLRELAGWFTAGVAILITAAGAYFYLPRGQQAPSRIVTQINAPPSSSFDFTGQAAGSLVLSPNGTRIAFVARGPEGRNVLWVRSLDSTEAHALPGTEDAAYPFWCWESMYLGFFSENKVKMIDTRGGPPTALGEATTGRGGSWAPDNTILYAGAVNQGLFRVPSAGGTPQEVTRLDHARHEFSHRWPTFLPDGKHFLVYVQSGVEENTGTYAGSLDGTPLKLIVRGGSAATYADPGYLLWVREDTLLAQHFDPKTLALSGQTVIVAAPVATNLPVQRGNFSVSNQGNLAFQPGAPKQGGVMFHWTDRAGNSVGAVGETGLQLWPQISPDGHRIALASFDEHSGNEDIWIEDADRSVRMRVTFDAANDWSAIWSPDGTRVAYASNRDGIYRIMTRDSAATGSEKEVGTIDGEVWVTSWSPDGNTLLIYTRRPEAKPHWQIHAMPLNGSAPFAITHHEFNTRYPVFSPDGHWIAYQSDESGQNEVYVAHFPDGEQKVKISGSGGLHPRWSRNGREILYVGRDNELTSTEVSVSAEKFQAGATHPLFRLKPPGMVGYTYDVSPDGRRFLVAKLAKEAVSEPITFIQNWMAGLR